LVVVYVHGFLFSLLQTVALWRTETPIKNSHRRYYKLNKRSLYRDRWVENVHSHGNRGFESNARQDLFLFRGLLCR
jgi:hypothetical protein